MTEKYEASEDNAKLIFQDKFLTRLAETSHITRRVLDEHVAKYGFKYIQANTLWVHGRGYKHFGSDLLTAYRQNPARAPLDRDVCLSIMHDALKS